MKLTTDKQKNIYYDILPGIIKFGKSLNFSASQLDELQEECENIALILSGDAHPSFFYDFINAGCYKAVYSIHRLDLALKFCSDYNIIQDEIDQYIAAQNANFGKVFLPSHFFELPDEYQLEMDTISENCFDDNICYFIEIQPLAMPIAENDSEEIYSSREAGEKYFTTHSISNFFEDFSIDYEIIKQNGEDYYVNLIKFLKKNYIDDLHCGNIGFYFPERGVMLPVLLDW